MKKLSTWGFYHPRSARRLMVLIKIAMILLAWYIAGLLQRTGIHFAADGFYVMAMFILAGVILYPDRRKKKVYFEYRYYIRQKLCDAVITFFSFGAFIILFNTSLSLKPAYGVEPVYRYDNTGSRYSINNPPADKGKISGKQNKAAKKSFLKQIKKIAASAKKGNKKHTQLIVEMVLAITLGVLLGITVVGLACSLACNGYEVAAVLVILFGAGGIIAGLITWIRSIRKRKKRIMMMPGNIE